MIKACLLAFCLMFLQNANASDIATGTVLEFEDMWVCGPKEVALNLWDLTHEHPELTQEALSKYNKIPVGDGYFACEVRSGVFKIVDVLRVRNLNSLEMILAEIKEVGSDKSWFVPAIRVKTSYSS